MKKNTPSDASSVPSSAQTSKYTEIVSDWKSKNIKTIEDLDIILDNYKIIFAYHSNRIENPEITYHDTREIFENGKIINFTGDVRTIFEIKNQKECYAALVKKIINKEPLSLDFIKEVHYSLMRNCYDEKRYARGEKPGTFKKHDYVVGDEIGSLAKDVPGLLSQLCEEINTYSGDDILTLGAYFHLTFEAIHPFADGNGRVGRTLMNYIFMTHNHPPTILYNEDKESYYMALAVFDKTGKIDRFKKFLQEQIEKTWSFDKVKLQPLKNL